MPSRTVVVATVCRRGLFSPMAPCGSSVGVQTPGGRAALGLGFCWTALAEGQGYKNSWEMLVKLPPGMNDLNSLHCPFLPKSGREVKPEKGSPTWKKILERPGDENVNRAARRCHA